MISHPFKPWAENPVQCYCGMGEEYHGSDAKEWDPGYIPA